MSCPSKGKPWVLEPALYTGHCQMELLVSTFVSAAFCFPWVLTGLSVAQSYF